MTFNDIEYNFTENFQSVQNLSVLQNEQANLI